MRFPPQPHGPETKQELEARLYAGQQIEQKRWAGWAHFGGSSRDLGVEPPDEFLFELEQLGDELIDSQAWCAWWAHAERPRLTLRCSFEGTVQPSSRRSFTRRTEEEVVVRRVWSAEETRLLGRAEARELVRDVMQDLARRYAMPPPPELPVTKGGPAPTVTDEDAYALSEAVVMPRAWTTDDGIVTECPVCQAVSRPYRTAIGLVNWLRKHNREQHS